MSKVDRKQVKCIFLGPPHTYYIRLSEGENQELAFLTSPPAMEMHPKVRTVANVK